MLCPRCGKSYSAQARFCPHCGNITQAQNICEDAARRKRRGDTPETARKRAARGRRAPEIIAAKHRKKRLTGRIVIALIWVLALLVIAAVMTLYFTGAFSSRDESEIGEKYLVCLLEGNTDKAMSMLGYDAKKFYADNWRAEYTQDFGGDFAAFSSNYMALGVSGTDIDSFTEAAYGKLIDDYRRNIISLGEDKYSISVEAEDERSYSKDDIKNYIQGVREAFDGSKTDIGDYIKFADINAVTEVKYTLTIGAGDAAQKAQCSLHIVMIGSEWRVMVTGTQLTTQAFVPADITGSWSYTQEADGTEHKITISFAGDGTGAISEGEKSLPMTYTLFGTNGLRMVSAAFDTAANAESGTCVYSFTDGRLVLSFTDGILTLTKEG